MTPVQRAIQIARERGMCQQKLYDPATGKVCASMAVNLGFGLTVIDADGSVSQPPRSLAEVAAANDLMDAANQLAEETYWSTDSVCTLVGVNDVIGTEQALGILRTLAEREAAR